ncbi:TPA: phage minor head protein [Haemophilus influenzae]
MKFTFENQVKYFEKKLNLPTNSYLDVLGEEHDYFFMVAGANRNEVLLAFREAVDEAINNGETLEGFRKRFDEVVARTGWDYKGGRNWRSRIIYDTNVYAAYNRGRLQQHLDLADVMPYWEYHHHDNAHPRQEHIDLDGTILPASDPFWRYYYPIKAYGCHCTVTAHDEGDLKEMGKTVSPSPEIEWQEKLVGTRSGNPRMVRVPKGYDVGFQPHNFERLTESRNHCIDRLLMQKLTNAAPKFASLLISDVLSKRPEAIKMLTESYQVFANKVIETKKTGVDFRYVGVLPTEIIDTLQSIGKAPLSAIIAVRDEDIWHAVRDLKKGKNIAMPLDFWLNIPEYLRKPKAILLQPKEMARNPADPKNKDTLLFIYDSPKGKLAIKLDYDLENQNFKVNLVRTASAILNDAQWQSLKAFKLLWGTLQ